MPIKFAITMLVYAVCLLVSGWITKEVAPPGASAATALIIPVIAAALTIAAAVLSLMIKSNRRLGMIGIHVGLVLPLIFAAGSLSRISSAISKSEQFNDQLGDVHSALEADNGNVTLLLLPVPDSKSEDRSMQARWMDGQTARTMEPVHPWRPHGYQAVGMISIAMLSVLAFVALLLHRPEIPKAEKKDETFDAEE